MSDIGLPAAGAPTVSPVPAGTGSSAAPTSGSIAIAGAAISFIVQVDDFVLGAFTACDGLGAEMVLEQREEGGNHLFVHQLPVRMKYPNIKLTRNVYVGSPSIAAWMTDRAARGAPPGTASIGAWDIGDGRYVAEWTLTGVQPVKWTGPQFNVDTNKPASESLELAHNGFTL